MSLMNLLNQAQGGQGLGNLAKQLGMEEEQAGGLASMLAPAIGSAAKKRAEGGGLGSLLGQLQGQASYCQIWCLRCCGSCGDLVLV